MRFLAHAPILCLAAAAFSGCASNSDFFGAPAAVPPTAIQGVLRGGLKPISGAHVYLMKVSSGGYGQAAVSLLATADTHTGDATGAYVQTDPTGHFAVPASYNCSSSDQVYLYATGGDAGAGPNSGTGLMAAIGNCPVNLGGPVDVIMNEITTVGTAYALAGFASDATHVGTSGSALAQVNLRNAFNNVGNLYSPADGSAIELTPGGNGTVPRQLIHTLAGILDACIESSGPTSKSCAALFQGAPSASGAIPTDTATAILNIAHSPGNKVAALYSLATPNTPFGPTLPVAPNDFTVGITFTGGGLNGAYATAIDGDGNAWFANLGNSTVSKLTPLGIPLSGTSGYNNGNPFGPVGIAIDLSGNAWVVNAVSGTLIKYTASGALLSPFPGYSGGGIGLPEAVTTDSLGNIWVANYRGTVSKFSNGGTPISQSGYTGGGILGSAGIAIDASGSVWVANTKGTPSSISKLTPAGLPISPASGFIGGGLVRPISIAIDSSGSAWAANFDGDSISKFAADGTPLSPSAGFVGGGLSSPFNIAVDGGGNIWAANFGAYSVSQFTNAGVALSPATGYTGGLLNGPQALAIDGSGNVWVANSNDISVTELIGAAVPVITPQVVAVKNNTIGTRP